MPIAQTSVGAAHQRRKPPTFDERETIGMIDIARIQAQLRAALHLSHEAVPAPPFTCFFHPENDATFANAALPDAPITGDVDAALEEVRRIFLAHGRRPRFEYLEAYAPDLGAHLERHGYRCTMRSQLMVCTPAQLAQPPWPATFSVSRLDGQSPDADVQDLLTVQARAFGDPDAPRVSSAEARQFRQRFRALQLFLARVDGVAVSAATLTAPFDEIAEVAGVATLPGFQRRGFAAALTFAVAQAAFAQGVELLFLTAGSVEAGRAYARAGFGAQGCGLDYLLAATDLPEATNLQ